MDIKELFERIKARIGSLEHTDKNTFSTICEVYGQKMGDMHTRFKNGQRKAPIAFAAYWMPWMLVNRIVMPDDLTQMEVEDLQKLRVYINAEREFSEGRRTVLGSSRIKATDSVRIFAFGESQVEVHDEATVHGYNNSVIQVHSGWCHAFHECHCMILGRGVAEGWDNSHVSVQGDALVYINDHAELSKFPNSNVLERK